MYLLLVQPHLLFTIILARVVAADIVPPPTRGLHGNSNYCWSPDNVWLRWLNLRVSPRSISVDTHPYSQFNQAFSNCRVSTNGQIINALQVVINFDTDFLFQTDFGFQLNCYPPAGHNIVYQQFCLNSGFTNSLLGVVNTWKDVETAVIAAGLKFIDLPPNKIPAGSQLSITLQMDRQGGVEGVLFVAVVDGKNSDVTLRLDQLPTSNSIPVQPPAPISAFTFNMVGSMNGMKGVFDAGSGSVLYWSSTNNLVTTSEIPAGLSDLFTAEDANIRYGEMAAAEGQFLVQYWLIGEPSRRY